MTKSYRISFRLNPEYDQDIINKLKCIGNRNLSRFLRKIIRENIQKYEYDALSDTKSIKKSPKCPSTKTIHWKFPQ